MPIVEAYSAFHKGEHFLSGYWPREDGLAACLLSRPGGRGPWDRWSIVPSDPTLLLRCDPATRLTTLTDARGVRRTWADPLEALAWMASTATDRPPASADVPFTSGWIGWLSYDLGRLFETLPSRAADDLGLPLFEFTYHPFASVVDASTDTVFDTRAAEPLATERLPVTAYVSRGDFRDTSTPPRSSFSRDAYEHAVRRSIEYIAAGDVFQVNLSQRFTANLIEDPTVIFIRAGAVARGWYSAFLRYEDHAIVSTSPELFLRVRPNPDGSRTVTTRPIKGTRPRQPGMDEQLRTSVKDQAELNMIIDLERNDLGRVCEIGSVKVTEPRTIEAHPTVYHGVATVEGTLRNDVSFVDLLRATFPGGSITGAPKIRAMQIIDELEPVRRGPYCGAIGYISSHGPIEFNVAIRTMTMKDGQVHVPVGGGIVADSEPAAEYEETLVKARAMFDALGISR